MGIGYGRQTIDSSDLEAVIAVLRSDFLTCGPAIEQFEHAIAAISGAGHAVALNNGTSALRLLYRAAGIGPGFRVGVPAITFVATASQALALGAEVVLLDVDPQTGLLTPEILAACMEPLDYVVPVHLAGRLCDMAGIAAWACQHGVTVLEDAAHAFGSTWNDDHRCGDGAWSRGAVFSFHPVKNITTGEGGAVVCKDAELAAQLRSLRHHGLGAGAIGPQAVVDAPWYHEFHEVAGNERLSDIQAALGLSQCSRLDAFKQARQTIFDRYRSLAEELPWLSMAPRPADQQPFWHLCQAHVDWQRLGMDRRALFASARKAEIGLQVHYIPLHHQPILAAAPRGSTLAGAEAFYASIIALPCFPSLAADQDLVVGWLRALA